MSVLQRCEDTSDCVSLFKGQNLFLKPLARLNVSVQLPQLHKTGNAKISNFDVMERLKAMAKPYNFCACKVSKSSIEFLRFDVELENALVIDNVIGKLDSRTIKLAGFAQSLKVRAAEAKQQNFPKQTDWEAFFSKIAEAKDRPGHRPDTIYVSNLPTKWFVNRQDRSGIRDEDRPSVSVIKKTFGVFGEIREIDVPCLDPYRSRMTDSSSSGGIAQFSSFDQDVLFDAYIQYSEYIGFVRALNELRGMKLLYKDNYDNKAWSSVIKVDFDRNAHLSAENIKKRKNERERLVRKEQEEEAIKQNEQVIADDVDPVQVEQRERERRRVEREERRRKRRLKEDNEKLKDKNESMNEEKTIAKRIALEERKLVVAQRKLEAIRLLDELVKRIKQSSSRVRSMETELLMTAAKAQKNGETRVKRNLSNAKSNEMELRYKLIAKMKHKEKQGTKGTDDNYESDEDNVATDASLSLEPVSSTGEEDDGFEEKESSDAAESPHKSKGKKRKKSKKSKKSKKKLKKTKKTKRSQSPSSSFSSSMEDDTSEREEKSRRKKRELDDQIRLAKQISRKENKELREEQWSDDEDNSYENRNKRSKKGSEAPKWLPTEDEIEAARQDALDRERHASKLRHLSEKKSIETAKEQLYDQMMNPHLYGIASHRYTQGSSAMLRRNQHYEEVQKMEMEEAVRQRELYEAHVRRQEQRERAFRAQEQRRSRSASYMLVNPRFNRYDHYRRGRSRSPRYW